MMRSHRGGWLGSSILVAAFLLMPAAPAVHAQPGFGPDPFWPYNNQYTPYVTPIGPADPGAGGQAGELYSREGIRGANQFQDYLDDIQGGGPGRNLSDRSNIGMPYYRSAVSPSYSSGRSGPRQYQANSRTNETFQDSQRKVSDIYFRYYSERNPARRSELLRQYRTARRDAALTISGRGHSPSQILDSSTRLEAGIRRGTRSSPAADRTRAAGDRIGPAPEVPPIGSRRSAAPSSAPRRTLPSDVLNRSQTMDRESRIPSAPRGVGPAPRSPGRRSVRSETPAESPADDRP